jgi:serine O-acetyltransferase
MEEISKENLCRNKIEFSHNIRKNIPKIVEEHILSCNKENCFDHVGAEPIPSQDAVIDLIHRIRRLLYPGYFIRFSLDELNLRYYLGEEVTILFEVISEQIILALRHQCIRNSLPCVQCEEIGQKIAIKFLKAIPQLRIMLAMDVRAAYEGDPAAKSYDDIIFSYPGIYAITVYRIAHQLHKQEVPLLPRIMTEYAHSQTGIDIHPGANIGESFFIDHGTGIVIGETTDIGNHVRIYQGVTLGALSLSKDKVEALRNQKRHPTIEDHVIIYSGATILGGETVIGARSIIGGNVWITESVPPDTKVFLKKPELIFKETAN